MIWADVYRRRGQANWSELLFLIVKDRTFRPIATLRLYQQFVEQRSYSPVRIIALILHRFVCNASAIDLSAKTLVGPGLAISHGWGLVVSDRAKLGSNVTLFHGVTIGQGDKIAPDGSRTVGYPIVEDDVWVGPNAAILGGITIGVGSRIMAGAIVSFDVPPHSMVIGNPGIIIKTDCATDCVNRAPQRLLNL